MKRHECAALLAALAGVADGFGRMPQHAGSASPLKPVELPLPPVPFESLIDLLHDVVELAPCLYTLLAGHVGNAKGAGEELLASFREWDEDGNGNIDIGEFRRALLMLGLQAAPEQFNELFAVFDTDGSGTISFRELNRQLRRDVKAEGGKKEKKEVESRRASSLLAPPPGLPHACHPNA